MQPCGAVICNTPENESSINFIIGCPSSSSRRLNSDSNPSISSTFASGSMQRTRDQSLVKRTIVLSGRPASRSSTPILTNSFLYGSGTYRIKKNSHCRSSFTPALCSSSYPIPPPSSHHITNPCFRSSAQSCMAICSLSALFPLLPQFEKETLEDSLKLVISSPTLPRRLINSSTSASIPVRSPPYHSGGTVSATLQMVCGSVSSIRLSHGSRLS